MIFVAGQWRPVLKMQWVEGLTLNQFVAQYLDRPAMLEALLQISGCEMATHLRTANIAHCDLQHGNVLLVPAASGPHRLRSKLIDYDGMVSRPWRKHAEVRGEAATRRSPAPSVPPSREGTYSRGGGPVPAASDRHGAGAP